MKKRILAILMCAILMSISLAGCGSDSGPVNKKDSSYSEKEDKKTNRDDKDEEDDKKEDAGYSLSDVDEDWGITTYNYNNDPKYAEAQVLLEQECEELDKYIAEYKKQLQQEELQEKAANYGIHGLFNSIVNSLGGEKGIYELICGAITGAVSGALGGDSSSGDNSGNYSEECKHKWKEAYFHKVGKSYTETEKIDGYVVKEEKHCSCQYLACYECTKCGSIKSFTLGVPGEYTQLGAYPCSAHFGEPEDSIIRTNR